MDTPPDAAEKHGPKVAMLFYDFDTGGPVAVVDRISQALQQKGAEVSILSKEETLERSFGGNPQKIAIDPEQWFLSKHCPDKAIRKLKPDVLIVEHYPFVEPKLAYGWQRAIDAARKANPNVKIYGVVRDIPAFEKNEKNAEAVSKAAAKLDHILVRGDENLCDIRSYFNDKQWARFGDKLSYVGYTVPPMRDDLPKKGGGVLVHLGGVTLSKDAGNYIGIINLIPNLPASMQDVQWRFVLSNNNDMRAKQKIENAIAALPEDVQARITLQTGAEDYLALAQGADMLITRGGISAVEALAYGKPAVVLPSRAPEQLERAEKITALSQGRMAMLKAGETTYEDVAKAIEQTYAQRRVKAPACPLRVGGDETIARGIADAHAGKTPQFGATGPQIG